MKYCTQCLSTDLRPNAHFSEAGVCIACQYSNDDKVVEDKRFKLTALQERIKQIRSRRRKRAAYDCIVGVSGGKDSTRQAHWVRDRLGLRPLLVCCAYPPAQMSDIGASNLSNLISMGFDLITATPAPQASRRLSLQAFRDFGNVCKSTELALFSTVPRLAIDLGINLIFWGENPALQVGDSGTQGIDEFDGNRLSHSNTLSTGGMEWMKGCVDEQRKLDHYRYPQEHYFDKNGISILFLGPAWDDWSNANNATYAALQGLTLRPNEALETGDISEASMLDEEYSNINMMLKYFKFGFGRATDIVDEGIRNGQLTRQQGIDIVKQYDGRCDDRIIASYCRYVGISETEFWQIAHQWVNTDLFDIQPGQRPQPRFTVGVDYGH